MSNRSHFREADRVPVPDLWPEAQRRAAQPSRRPPMTEGRRTQRMVAGLIALALFAGGSLLAARVFLRGDGGRTASSNPWAELPPGWTQLPSPPFERSDPATAWTGEELILWGGGTDYNANFFGDGAAYSPVAGRWEPIADGPLAARADPSSVWTGSELLIWGGFGRSGLLTDGAAYDPEADSWRMLPPAPWIPPGPAAHVWTGRELVVFGEKLDFVHGDASETSGMAYDPAADTWRHISTAPMALNSVSAVWTGDEAVFFGADLDGDNVSATRRAQGMAYDPAGDSWRVLPEHRISPQASWANWTGSEMLVWDHETSSALYDPVTDSWREPNPMPIEFSECYPYSVRASDFVFAWFCGQMARFDIEADSWAEVERGPVEFSRNDPLSIGEPVGAGDVVVVLLSRKEGNNNPGELSEMWAYRPG